MNDLLARNSLRRWFVIHALVMRYGQKLDDTGIFPVTVPINRGGTIVALDAAQENVLHRI